MVNKDTEAINIQTDSEIEGLSLEAERNKRTAQENIIAKSAELSATQDQLKEMGGAEKVIRDTDEKLAILEREYEKVKKDQIEIYGNGMSIVMMSDGRYIGKWQAQDKQMPRIYDSTKNTLEHPQKIIYGFVDSNMVHRILQDELDRDPYDRRANRMLSDFDDGKPTLTYEKQKEVDALREQVEAVESEKPLSQRYEEAAQQQIAISDQEKSVVLLSNGEYLAKYNNGTCKTVDRMIVYNMVNKALEEDPHGARTNDMWNNFKNGKPTMR